MSGFSGMRIEDGRITFPKGVKPSVVKDNCKTCSLNLDCHGPDSKGFADVNKPREISEENLDSYILSKAACVERG